MLTTHEIRSAFLDFFAERGHRIVPSSSLVPANDPTLLFTNAGMVQFKDALTGRETPSYRRAASCQRCVRAGGKHNDLENVGYTGRHQTLFEMLGNFSFGDYFKEDAITWAWQFVTDVLQLPKDRLWVTTHPDDDDARRIWVHKIGLDPARVVPHEDNFWAMGDTGPCGPDSELFYDLGPDVPGGPPGSPNEDGDRYSEFWNLVFPQFDRAPDGTLTPLDSPGVDTGMGLERIATIVQGGDSNYDNDLFRQLMDNIVRTIGVGNRIHGMDDPSLRVIADHARSAAFPDRRWRHARQRGARLRFAPYRAPRSAPMATSSACASRSSIGWSMRWVDAMGGAYPELDDHAERIATTLRDEGAPFRSHIEIRPRALESRHRRPRATPRPFPAK